MKQRPNVEAILEPLKSFQRRTVDHAFHRLFEAPDSTYRFLVADEVGLGKTLVARGIIARAIEHYWDDVEQIDIIYICSNGSIARANLPKLQVGVGGNRAFALATRLTLLATELAPAEGRRGLAANKVNFVSFTPATSFNMGQSSGRSDERVVLFHLLKEVFDQRTALMNFLQGNIASADVWRKRLTGWETPIEPNIHRAFLKTLDKRPQLRRDIEDLLGESFSRRRKELPAHVRTERNRLIGRLRRLLADECVQALQPDLVILDEFQRFKSLIDTRPENQDPAADLAQALFRAKTPEGHPVRTLLLSATPYKLYTTDAEIEQEDHYKDFLSTTRFLMDDADVRVDMLKHHLARFNSALKRAAAGIPDQVVEAKHAVEKTLRSVMARTERVTATESRDAMVEEPRVRVAVQAVDVNQYLAADALFQAVGERDPAVFWKSAPYLLNFMHGYRFNVSLTKAIEESATPLHRVLRDHSGAFLHHRQVMNWSAIDPAHGKLRDLIATTLEGGKWRLLWMPPTVPYWPLEGPYAGSEGSTKTLLFSAWNVVPDVVSGVLSYEAERRMVDGQMQRYLNPDKQQVPRLRLTRNAEGTLSRHRLFLLLLPCLPLADVAHPLQAPAGVDARVYVRERVEGLLAKPEIPNPQDGDVDDRWEWAAPLILDPELRTFIEEWKAGENETLPRPNPEVLPAYLEELLAVDLQRLGRRPENLVDLLTEMALGSPPVLAARTLLSVGLDDNNRRANALRIAEAFWRLFNRPAVISLLSQLYSEVDESRREEGFYWRQVLRYCMEGNLQAVLDETWHLMREQAAWSENGRREESAASCSAALAEVIQPAVARVHARFLSRNAKGIKEKEVRIRTVFALRFGTNLTEEGQLSHDAQRAQFNSPFRPFVLTSTSIGQEGLDFHPWCHRLVHWDLPGNPVDLEQREGRVHRYKGHAVRLNVAAVHGREARAAWQPGRDLWNIIFQLADQAARATKESDLVPYWVAPGPHRVQRYVPLLPYSREVEAFANLKRQLAAYRVVFGQPRQEELMGLLNNAELDTKYLQEWAIDLSPPGSLR